MTKTTDTLFEAFSFPNGLTLRNRVVMAPMTTWSSNADETVSEQELAWYRARAGGVGLVLTGCTHVTENGVGFTHEFAAYDDRFIPGLSRLAEAAKSGGAPAVLQIFHAGNKAVHGLIPGGEMVSASATKASPGPFNDGQRSSRALDHDEILDVIRAFGEATRRAIAAGFDGVELHGAHGFLIQNFFSPLYNQRADDWGGSLENRMRFPLDLVQEVRRVVAAHADRPFLVGYRISPEESGEGALRIGDACMLMERLIERGIDYLHVSLSDLLAGKPLDYVGEQTTIEKIVERVGQRVPLIAAGGIRQPEQARKALALGLPLVAVGRGLATTPDWVELSRMGSDAEIDIALDFSREPEELRIPDKLWNVIRATTGWFPVRDDALDVA
ncbi:NADH-dependent flavin oxidoreductase [Paraburkholderia sp. J76]|uniref:NADH-dependent flavin oxidoreductase n=1 Tax=Paraburkholderia sp. J76 TaxID=2805439 RepID=UPI002ABE4B61|nr:NADH-dependent flavin oxidoreductase [Paraburkholderia sp. J76]